MTRAQITKVASLLASHGLFFLAGSALSQGYIAGGLVAGAFGLLTVLVWNRFAE